MQDDEVVGVVRDLDVAGGRIEQPGVPAGRAADRLLDRQRLFEGRPGEADPVGQDGQPGREQTGHALGPRRVVLPGADVDLDRRAQDVGVHRGVAVGAWAVGDEVGEELERPVERAAAEDRAAGRRRWSGAAILPASTLTSKPSGKTTVTELPGVLAVANAQTGNETSESPMRRSRVAAPPGSVTLNCSRYFAVLPLNRRPARSSRSLV